MAFLLVIVMLALAPVGVYAQQPTFENNPLPDFEQFVARFNRVPLPFHVDAEAMLCCSDRPPEIDSLAVRKFLPAEAIDDLSSHATFRHGQLVWRSVEAFDQGLKHLALVWYVETDRPPFPNYAFISTYSLEGKHVDTVRVSTYASTMSSEALTTAWLVGWMHAWSIVVEDTRVYRPLNGSVQRQTTRCLYNVSPAGIITGADAEDC